MRLVCDPVRKDRCRACILPRTAIPVFSLTRLCSLRPYDCRSAGSAASAPVVGRTNAIAVAQQATFSGTCIVGSLHSMIGRRLSTQAQPFTFLLLLEIEIGGQVLGVNSDIVAGESVVSEAA